MAGLADGVPAVDADAAAAAAAAPAVPATPPLQPQPAQPNAAAHFALDREDNAAGGGWIRERGLDHGLTLMCPAFSNEEDKYLEFRR